MKIRDILNERIEQTLFQDAYEGIKEATKQWLAVWYPKVLKRVGIEDIRAQASALDKEDKWDERAKIVDAAYERLNDSFNHARENKDDEALYIPLMSRYRNALELKLQEVARSYIESKLGKIEPYDHATDDMSTVKSQKRLYWLQHIVVDLDTRSKNKKGEIHSGGGHFQAYPSVNNYPTDYVRDKINPKTDLAVAIKLHMKPDTLFKHIEYLIKGEFQEYFYGEPYWEEDPVHAIAKAILPTYTHEVVHLEQNAREQHADYENPGKKHHFSTGISYTPNPGKKREKVRDYEKHKAFRKGKRGRPSHLPGLGDRDIPEAEFAEYLGSAHEIEAHAAGAAASLISEMIADLWMDRKSPNDRQRAINEGIDILIDDLKGGVFYNSAHSLMFYYNYIRSKIAKDTPEKVNKTYRKVWVIFMNKLVRHLLAYKKPIPQDQDSWWEEEHPQPKQGRNIQHPAKKPNLP